MAKCHIIEQMFKDETMIQAKKRMQIPVGGIQLCNEQIESAWCEFQRTRDRIKKEIMNMVWRPGAAAMSILEHSDGSDRTVMILSPLDRLIQEAVYVVLNQKIRGFLGPSVFQFDAYRGVRSAHERCCQILEDGHIWALQYDVHNCSEELDQRFVLNRLRKILLNEEEVELYRSLMRLSSSNWYDERYEISGLYASAKLTGLLVDLALKDLDEFLEKKKVPFVRFGDDVMAFCDSLYEAKQLLETVQSFLAQTLNLQLNPRKTAVQRGVYGPFPGRLLCYDSRHECHHIRSVRKDQ